ncbi:MAG: TetR family transcriptional regulator [Candidatus Nephthysia bennettiae]|nr:MAG: TetR family transcriptional regulator [Candidatus Dormibacteraeota bacterium]
MSDEPIDRILDAAYASFARHGVRRTTMDDIATAAQMSRPAVYQYVRNKDDAFRQLGTRLFDAALQRATAAAADDGRSVAARLYGVLCAKLELALQLERDSPHAGELLDASARLFGELFEGFIAATHGLLVGVLDSAAARGEIDLTGLRAAEIADVALALERGLVHDPADPERPLRQQRLGVDLIVAGLSR